MSQAKQNKQKYTTVCEGKKQHQIVINVLHLCIGSA